MSVLKRLGNVARGKMLEVGRTFSGEGPRGPSDLDDADDPEQDPDREPPPRAPGASPDPRRALLERMREEGLLSDAEVAEKLATLDAPPAAPVSRKRTL